MFALNSCYYAIITINCGIIVNSTRVYEMGRKKALNFTFTHFAFGAFWYFFSADFSMDEVVGRNSDRYSKVGNYSLTIT